MKRIVLLLFILSFSSLKAKIIEIHSIDEAKPYIKNKHLIIFDIDNTIMEPVQELGTDQWFYYYMQQCLEQGLAKKDALNKALRAWSAIQSFTKMKLVESKIRGIIANLQANNMTVMGMTTRDLSLCICTLDQLRTLEINLGKTAPSKKEFYMNNGGSILFRDGVLFTSGTHKGQALLRALDKLNYRPQSVIFINDKETHIKQVQDECDLKGIEFIGLRYGYLDDKVANFDQRVANIQHQHFGTIMSDNEARKILSN